MESSTKTVGAFATKREVDAGGRKSQSGRASTTRRCIGRSHHRSAEKKQVDEKRGGKRPKPRRLQGVIYGGRAAAADFKGTMSSE